jgi:hypothetical protein
VVDAGSLGRVHGRRCLLEFVGARFPTIGDREDAVGPGKRGPEGFGAIEIRFDDFVRQPVMPTWMASQGTYLELALGLQGTYDCAALLSCVADRLELDRGAGLFEHGQLPVAECQDVVRSGVPHPGGSSAVEERAAVFRRAP